MSRISHKEKPIATATGVCELEWRNLSTVAVATA